MDDEPDNRFLTSVLVLATCGIASILISLFPAYLCSILALVLAIFVAQWFYLFSPTLTRKWRVIIDEANVLRTTPYRSPYLSPRKEAMTPAPGSQAEREMSFKEARDAHYANEFKNIPKLNEENSKRTTVQLPPESEKLMKMFEDNIESHDI